MCLAVPGRIIDIDAVAQTAVIDYNGLQKKASMMLCPNIKNGDIVLVHAGFIIQILSEDYGNELEHLWKEVESYAEK